MSTQQQNHSLKSDVIGLLGAATLGVVMLSPAMTLYGGFGPTYLSAGAAAPLVFIFALLATIPTAISYVILSRDYPVSGSAASWAAKATTPGIGVWAGYMVFFYYFTNFIIQPITLGVFFGDFLKFLNLPPELATGVVSFIIGGIICLGWAAYMVYRGISISAKGALAFLAFETAVVVGLCLTVLALAPDHGIHLNTDGFSLAASPTGSSGIFRAMVFSMLAYCGFDVVSTLAEETKMAKKLIPQATILSLVIYAVIIVAGIWALTFGGSPETLKKVADSGQMPITAVAETFWGRGSIMITLTAISASLGLAIATAVGASRILFSMGREGLAPKRFFMLHPSYKIPWNALHVIFAGGLVATVVSGFAVGPYNSYVWWGTTSTFFAMVTYLLVNLSNIILNRAKIKNGAGSFLAFFLIPLIGIVVDGYIVYRSFFVEQLSQDWLLGKSVVVFDMLCVVGAIVLAVRHLRKK